MPDQLSVITRMFFACATLVGTVVTVTAAPNTGSSAPQTTAALTTWKKLYARPASKPSDRNLPRNTHINNPAAIALGNRLFQDTRLSSDGTRSCATCHVPALGFTDRRRTPPGPDGRPGKRNTPTLLDLQFATALNWDGESRSLEQQSRGPIEGPLELNSSLAAVVTILRNDAEIVTAAKAAFTGMHLLEPEHITKALAAYERTLTSPRTRFDSWTGGDKDALINEERAGFALFVGKGGCARCHTGWRFTDDNIHDVGRPASERRTAFKTPSLRELTSTAPYMHDGSLPTLEAVVRHYASTVEERSSLSPNLNIDLELSEQEIQQIVAFLKTLSSD